MIEINIFICSIISPELITFKQNNPHEIIKLKYISILLFLHYIALYYYLYHLFYYYIINFIIFLVV